MKDSEVEIRPLQKRADFRVRHRLYASSTGCDRWGQRRRGHEGDKVRTVREIAVVECIYAGDEAWPELGAFGAARIGLQKLNEGQAFARSALKVDTPAGPKPVKDVLRSSRGHRPESARSRRARSTTGWSIISPLWETTPPVRLSQAATIARASAISVSVAPNSALRAGIWLGWMHIAPVSPIAWDRFASAANASRSV